MSYPTDITTPTRQLDGDTVISVRFRTGTEVHAARANSTMAKCGRWLRFQARANRAYGPVTCEQCNGDGDRI